MKTPFEILNIPEDSGDEAVKKGYLAMVKQFPPERFPTEFQRIRSSYEIVKTKKDRLRFALFDQTIPSPDDLIQDVKASTSADRPSEHHLQKLLAAAVQQMDPME